MRQTILFIAAILIVTVHQMSAQVKSCCSANGATEFAMLGSNKSFQSAHLTPLPFVLEDPKGINITFPVTDGKEGRGYLIKSDASSTNYLLVFHEWWGLNDYIRQESQKLAAALPGVNVLAVDLYDGRLAANADEAGKMMQAVDQARAEAIVKGALAYAGTSAKIQTIGWCFGGSWSLQGAIIAGKQASGCVMYYGAPEKNTERLKMLEAPVLGIFALKDGWINKPMIEDFQRQMDTMDKKLTVKWYDADHAFANPSNPKFDKAATEDAHKLAVDFLKKNY